MKTVRLDRIAFAFGIIIAGTLLPGVARAECGHVAQMHAHAVLTTAEAMPVGGGALRTAVIAKLDEMPVVSGCPDDPPKLRDSVTASYQVYIAWRSAIDAFSNLANLRESPATRKACEPVWVANVRDTLANGYDAFSRTAPRDTSPDDLHVIGFLRGKAKTLGFTLPRPYSFRFARPPLSMQADTVRAHLPSGLSCY
ncbi:MAG: hypothetical protein JO083_06170 [Candidatus Eremiobacteraeota bacterium]|nr:hypothetical protein [Candidatus Eremiobacteraeota bacterium]